MVARRRERLPLAWFFTKKISPGEVDLPGISEVKVIIFLLLCADAALHATVDGACVGSNLSGQG